MGTVARQLATLILNLSTTIVVARSIGPAGSGGYTVALVIANLLALTFNFGIGVGNVYFLNIGDDRLGTAWRTGLRIYAVGATAGGLIAYAVLTLYGSSWLPGIRTGAMLVALAAFPLILVNSLVASLLQSQSNFRALNMVTLVGPAITFIGVASMALFHSGSLEWALAAFAGGQVLTLVHGVIRLRPYLTKTRGQPSKSERDYASKVMRFGWKAHVGNVLTLILYRLDLFMISALLSPVSVGLYAIATQLAERLWLLSEAVSTVLLPRLSALHGQEEARRRLTATAVRSTLLLTSLGAVLMGAFAPQLLALLFGTAFLGAADAIRWLMPGMVFQSVARILSSDLAARGRPDLNLKVALIAVPVNVAFCVTLIQIVGIAGASIAATLTFALNACAKIALHARLTGSRWSDLARFSRDDLLLIQGHSREVRGGR